jgi:hypothetical protein
VSKTASRCSDAVKTKGLVSQTDFEDPIKGSKKHQKSDTINFFVSSLDSSVWPFCTIHYLWRMSYLWYIPYNHSGCSGAVKTKKLNAAGHIARTPLNDRTNTQYSGIINFFRLILKVCLVWLWPWTKLLCDVSCKKSCYDLWTVRKLKAVWLETTVNI